MNYGDDPHAYIEELEHLVHQLLIQSKSDAAKLVELTDLAKRIPEHGYRLLGYTGLAPKASLTGRTPVKRSALAGAPTRWGVAL